MVINTNLWMNQLGILKNNANNSLGPTWYGRLSYSLEGIK